MKHIFSTLSILVMVVLFAACSDELNNGSFRRVEVESSNVNFTSLGGSGEIVLLTPDVTATSSESWCKITVNGKNIAVQVEPNMSVEERTAIVNLKANGMSDYYIPITQMGIRIKIQHIRSLIGEGEETTFEYVSDYPIDVKSVSKSWLKVALEDNDMLKVTADPNTSRTDARGATVVFVPRGMTGPELPISFTQENRPPYLYTDFLGKYDLSYSVTYNDSTLIGTIEADIVEGVKGDTYYLKGLMKDDSFGNIQLIFDKNVGVIYQPHLIGRNPLNADQDIWALILYYNSDGGYVNVSTAYKLASFGFEASKYKEFKLRQYATGDPNNILTGIYLRYYPKGTTSGGGAWKDGATNDNGRYVFSKFVKK